MTRIPEFMSKQEPKQKQSIRNLIATSREWLTLLEKSLELEDEVISWIKVEQILRAANGIAWEAGRLNGAIMEEKT